MAKLKAHEVDAFLAKSAPGYRIYLVYGPDRGLVSERARVIAVSSKIPLDDPFSIVRLDASTINSDPARLADEALTISMFGGERLVWVKDAGNEKGLVEAVKALASSEVAAAIVIIEADDLKPSSSLRALCEGAKTIMALPCYSDDIRSIDRLIDSELASYGMTASLDARSLLKASLGGDRLATRGEIGKLLLYCHGQTRIEVADVEAAIGDVSTTTVDELLDAVLDGNPPDLENTYSRVMQRGTSIQTILSAVSRQLSSLAEQRHSMDREGKTAAAAVASAKPPVFFARKALVERVLGGTSTGAFMRYLERVQSTTLESRKNADLAMAICHRTLMSIALEQARNRSVQRR